jgi:enoyl-CoA hydratase
MPYSTLLVEKKGGITTVTLNRPKQLNTLSTQVFFDLRQLMAELRYDLETRIVVFTGAGRAFSGGFDFHPDELKQHYSHPELPNERTWQLFCQDLMTAIENLEQVTIAAIRGACVGGGLCIAANCDLRIAAEDARLGVPEANLGIFLSWGATPRLASLLGPARAKELIMTCDLLDSREAYRIGLVNKVVPNNYLMEACYEMAEKILSRGPLSVRICKKQVNAASFARLSHLFLLESELWERNQLSPDVYEGIMATVEKRPPRFKPEANKVLKFE